MRIFCKKYKLIHHACMSRFSKSYNLIHVLNTLNHSHNHKLIDSIIKYIHSKIYILDRTPKYMNNICNEYFGLFFNLYKDKYLKQIKEIFIFKYHLPLLNIF